MQMLQELAQAKLRKRREDKFLKDLVLDRSWVIVLLVSKLKAQMQQQVSSELFR